jgi:transcriptional regulator with XRE-family HTH domain
VQEGFAITIRGERERLGFSQSSFATLVGTSLATLKRWETGISVPCFSQQEFVLRAAETGVRPEFLKWKAHPGWWLRIARNQSHLSIRQASEKSGISPSAWHRYEAGETMLGYQHSIDLANLISSPGAEQSLFSVNDAYEYVKGARFNDPKKMFPILFTAMMDIESGTSGIDAENSRRILGQAHVLLGTLLLQHGDHDLAGQSFFAATKIGKRDEFEISPFANVEMQKVWRGFPYVRDKQNASLRLQWLEGKFKKYQHPNLHGFAMMRSMFADWAGEPSLAQDILESAHQHLKGSPEAIWPSLGSAWLFAKYRNPKKALDLVEIWLNEANPLVEFVASKVATEAFYRLGERDQALEHFKRLRQLESTNGLWAPGLDSLQRKVGLPKETFLD